MFLVGDIFGFFSTDSWLCAVNEWKESRKIHLCLMHTDHFGFVVKFIFFSSFSLFISTILLKLVVGVHRVHTVFRFSLLCVRVFFLYFSSLFLCDFVGDKWNVCAVVWATSVKRLEYRVFFSTYSLYERNTSERYTFFAFSLCPLCCLLASNHCSPYRCGFVLNK